MNNFIVKTIILSLLSLLLPHDGYAGFSGTGPAEGDGKRVATLMRQMSPGFGNFSGHRPSQPEKRYKDDEILVKFKPDAAEKKKENLHKKHGSQLLKEFKSLRLHHVRLKKGLSVDQAVESYRSDPDVAYAEPDYLFKVQAVPNDPSYADLWGMAKINAAGAWNTTTGSDSVVVAIIDTGVDYSHPDLAANLWVNSADSAGNGIDDDANGFIDDLHGINAISNSGNPMDDHGHGTHVAGTIGAIGNNGVGVVGVNWDVKTIGCKFLGATGSGSTSGAVTCLQYIKALKTRGVNIVATNNSWGGGGYSQALYDAIDNQRDILFIAAAGNDSSDNDITSTYPAGYDLPNIVAIAATDSSDDKAYFSNHGRRSVHVGAPGYGILSTLPALNIWSIGGGYGTLSGTSMATPHATGLAALLKAQDATRDWRAIKNLIMAGGDAVSSMDGTTVTGKRINAYGSLNCSNSPVFSVLKAPRLLAVGTEVTLSALSINCGLPAGPVTVTVAGGGEPITLSDDGTGPDAAAGDGIFTGTWTPTQEDRLTFSSSAGSETITLPPLVISHYLAAGNLNQVYRQPLVALGGKPPYGWEVVSGNLPPGLTFSSATGEISGTPTALGSYSFTAQVTDALNSVVTKALTISVTDDMVAEVWARTHHLVSQDFANDTAIGPNGNIYVAGASQNGSTYDFSMVCYDASGNVVWTKTYDGGLDEFAYGIAVDGGGDIYLSGTSSPSDSSSSSYLTVKFNAAGDFLWAKTYTMAPNADNVGTDVALDSSGNAYVTGFTIGQNGSSLLTVKYDPSGDVLWSKIFAGAVGVAGYYRPAIAVDSAGNSFITAEKTNWFWCGPTCGTDTHDVITIKYDASGNLLWEKIFDNGTADMGSAVAVDVAGNAYVTGATLNGGYKFLTIKYDPAGEIVWTSVLPVQGVDPRDGKRGISVDAEGNSYIGSSAFGSVVDSTVFKIAKLDPAGNLLWEKSSGTGLDWTWGSGIAVDGQGNVYAAGYSPNGTNHDFLTIKYRQVAAPFRITTAAVPFATTGLAYNKALAATDGTGSYSWSVSSGSLPSGLSLNGSSGLITGTPATAGTFTFTVQAVDASAASATKTFSISVLDPVVITTGSLPPGVYGASYSQIVEVTGGMPYYWWTVVSGTLPQGLALYNGFSDTGKNTFATISGVLTGGNQTFTVQVQDGNAVIATKVLTIVSEIVIVTTTLTDVKLGSAYSQGLNAIGGSQPYNWAIVSGSLPPGLTLNDSTGVISGTPTLEGTFSFSVRVTDSYSATDTRSLAITVYLPKQPYMWGSNSDGQFGDGTTNGSNTPVPLAGLSGVTAIAAGGFHTVALNADGTVKTWGSNWSGELGDGTTIGKLSPVQVPGLTGVTAIAAGWSHTMALKSDGTVWNWGYPPSGNDSNRYSKSPVQVSQSSGLLGVIAIAGGNDHSLALKSDGTVWTWGFNGNGQLGDGTTNDSYTPLQVPGLTGITAIAGGIGYSVALKSDGTVRTWGRNDAGQLGDGTTTQRESPVQVSGLTGVTAIAAGNMHTMALKSDGTVRTWGYNNDGELGDGSTTERHSPVSVSGLAGVTAIAAGSAHSIVILGDGTVQAWGWNIGGEVGDGTTWQRNAPVPVTGLTEVTAIAGAAYFSVALAKTFEISDDSLPAGSPGFDYHQSLTTSGGTSPFTWSIYLDATHEGSLPDGLALDSSTGVISGVPTAVGSYAFHVRVTDGAGKSTIKRLTIDVGTCVAMPLRLVGTSTTPFTDIFTAYAQAADDDVIQLHAVNFSGDVDFSREIRLSLKGGYDCGYSGNSGSSVIASGKLKVSGGTAKVDKLRFK